MRVVATAARPANVALGVLLQYAAPSADTDPYTKGRMSDMHTMTVLSDGPFQIKWRGGKTFNVYALDETVNVFSSGFELSSSELTEEWARRTAHEWWTESGKEATQEVIRETYY